jgi:hypothetical protein
MSDASPHSGFYPIFDVEGKGADVDTPRDYLFPGKRGERALTKRPKFGRRRVP